MIDSRRHFSQPSPEGHHERLEYKVYECIISSKYSDWFLHSSFGSAPPRLDPTGRASTPGVYEPAALRVVGGSPSCTLDPLARLESPLCQDLLDDIDVFVRAKNAVELLVRDLAE